MRYSLITLYLILISAIPVYSQWGIKGGLDGDWFKSPNGTDGGPGYNPRMGFHLGGTYDLLLSDKIYLQPELLFTSSGSSIETAFNPPKEIGKGFVEIYAIEVPLKLSFRPPIGKQSYFVLDLGLYARYGLFGRSHVTYGSEKTVKESPFKDYKRFDAGFNLGIGFQFNRISTGLMYQQGFSGAEKDGSSPHTSFRLSIGYKI